MLLVLFLFLTFEARKKKKFVSKLRQSLGVAEFHKSMEKHKPQTLQINFLNPLLLNGRASEAHTRYKQ